MQLNGVNGAQYGLHIDSQGRAEAHAVSTSEQSQAAIDGDAYNFNTSNLTLTDANETPIFYIKNDSEERDLIINRVFVTFGPSTGGSGVIAGKVKFNVTGGTITTAGTDKAPANFNAGSSKTLEITSKVGASTQTVTGGTDPIEFLFPAASSRHLVGFESVILPRGASMALTITPPAGNTSMLIQAGTNIYIKSVD